MNVLLEKTDKIIDALKILNGALRMNLSVQSTEESVMVNVKRANISTEQMLALVPTLKECNLPTVTEIIIGLPGDTYDSNIKTIKDMMSLDVDEYLIYTCMLLHGSELNTPKEREKWGFKTKFRILPREFATLQSGKKVLEIEEVVISSNTLSFEDYLKIRLLAFSIFVTSQSAFKPITKFLRQNNVPVFDLFNRSLDFKALPKNIKKLFEEFKQATIDELWDSPEEIHKNFQNEDEYNKLLNDQLGFNVIYFYRALVNTKYLDEWTEFIISLTKKLLLENNIHDKSILEQFDDIANYCRGSTYNFLELNSNLVNPEFILKYDVQKWNDSASGNMIEKFQFMETRKIMFNYTEEESKLFIDNLNLYGTSTGGMSQIVRHIPQNFFWRHPLIIS